MMNNTLEKRAATTLDALQREDWMELPQSQMTAAQKKELREFEKLVQAYEDEVEKRRRMAEGEQKAMEEEVLGLLKDFNTELWELHGKKVDAGMLVASAQQQASALASTLELVRMRAAWTSEVSFTHCVQACQLYRYPLPRLVWACDFETTWHLDQSAG